MSEGRVPDAMTMMIAIAAAARGDDHEDRVVVPPQVPEQEVDCDQARTGRRDGPDQGQRALPAGRKRPEDDMLEALVEHGSEHDRNEQEEREASCAVAVELEEPARGDRDPPSARRRASAQSAGRSRRGSRSRARSPRACASPGSGLRSRAGCRRPQARGDRALDRLPGRLRPADCADARRLALGDHDTAGRSSSSTATAQLASRSSCSSRSSSEPCSTRA